MITGENIIIAGFGSVEKLISAKADILKKITITIGTDWQGEGDSYTQPLVLEGITPNSKVDLQPDSAAIKKMMDSGVSALFVSNTDGTLLVNLVGSKTTEPITMQATVEEVI